VSDKKIAVVAFGGNALLQSDEEGTQEQQLENSDRAAEIMVNFLKQGYELIIVHGNGPQVGNVLLQQESLKKEIHPYTMDYCVAMTQGSMGYMLENSLRYVFEKEKIKKEVICVVTQVIVDKGDPRFDEPTKPVGPPYSEEEAEELKKEKNWEMVEETGRGWRRVVPSPIPKTIVSENLIKQLVESGAVVIAAGGGGIPVYINKKGYLTGIEAVIDKDRASSLLASHVNAALFVILTEVEQVYLNFGKENQQPLPVLTTSEAQKYYEDGHFPKGNMGPKITSAIDFIKNGGKEVIITKASKLAEALRGETGTRITA
jgi:carbamate kinase